MPELIINKCDRIPIQKKHKAKYLRLRHCNTMRKPIIRYRSTQLAELDEMLIKYRENKISYFELVDTQNDKSLWKYISNNYNHRQRNSADSVDTMLSYMLNYRIKKYPVTYQEIMIIGHLLYKLPMNRMPYYKDVWDMLNELYDESQEIMVKIHIIDLIEHFGSRKPGKHDRKHDIGLGALKELVDTILDGQTDPDILSFYTCRRIRKLIRRFENTKKKKAKTE